MKKQRLLTLILLSIFLFTMLTGCTSDNDQTTERTQSVNVEDQSSDTLTTDGDWDDDQEESDQISSADLLSKDKIRSIAETRVPNLKGIDLQMKLDSDDGIKVYEVDARTSDTEYEFEINAVNGDILSYGQELIHPKAQTSASSDIISETKVRSIVEKYTAELKDKDMIIERDTDDGIKVYEVDARTSTHEYEYKIDAYSGEVISYDEEMLNK